MNAACAPIWRTRQALMFRIDPSGLDYSTHALHELFIVADKSPLELIAPEELRKGSDMAKKDDRDNNARQPYKREIRDTDIRLIEADHLKRRREGENSDRDDVREQA